ncbi:hypothetical protein M3Y99_00366900 [Aphelenchoides fujianensis]|nr:hypothetical protein M3Y99_00366900 [Aphelenchoides fujianensis]
MKDELPLPVALLLAFAAVVLALLPAFGILGVYQSLVLESGVEVDDSRDGHRLPAGSSFLFAVHSLSGFQFVGLTVMMLAAVVVYADLAFPLVMRAFAAIFARIRVD